MFPRFSLCNSAGDGIEGGAQTGAAPGASAPTAIAADNSSTNLPDPSTPAPGEAPASAAPASVAAIAADHSKVYAGFNPAIHATNPDGTPKLTPTGRFAKKAGLRQNSAAVASTTTNVSKGAVVGVPVDHWPVAKQITNVGVNLAVRFIGPEWEPRDKDELPQVAFALKDYFDARGVPQMPPEVVLLLAIGAYAAPRLNHDNTRKKLSRFFNGVKDWYKNLRTRAERK